MDTPSMTILYTTKSINFLLASVHKTNKTVDVLASAYCVDRSSKGSTTGRSCTATAKENLKDEHLQHTQENRPPGHRGGGIDRDCRSSGGGHGGRGHVHQELRAMQEDVGRLLRGATVR